MGAWLTMTTGGAGTTATVAGVAIDQGVDAQDRAAGDHAAEDADADEDAGPRQLDTRDQPGAARGTAGRAGAQGSRARRAGEDVRVDLADRHRRGGARSAAAADPPDLLASDLDGHRGPPKPGMGPVSSR